MPFEPNEHWYYNNWDFNALTTIFEEQTIKRIFDAFLDDIGITLKINYFDLDLQKYHYEDVSIHPTTLWYFSANKLQLLGQLLLEQDV